MKIRNRASSALAAALLMTGLAPALAPALAPSAAAASPARRTLSPTELVATDSRRPELSTVLNGQLAPLGTTELDAEGVSRRAAHRAYATYDLTSMAGPGTVVHDVVFSLRSFDSTNCKTTDLTVSTVAAPVRAITWADAPAVTGVVARNTSSHLCDDAEWTIDATATVQAALGRGERSITIEIRVTGSKELSPSYGRHLYPPTGDIEFTSSPFVLAGSPRVNGMACEGASDLWVGPVPALTARVGGSDRRKTVEFRLWREGEAVPDVPRTVESWGEWVSAVTYPWSADEALAEGTHLWQVRAVTESEASEWTAPCRLVVDPAPPASPPVVTVLGDGEVVAGRPVKLHIQSGGVEDVRCYQLAAFGQFSVPGDGQDSCEIDNAASPASLGGDVTVEFPTTQDGPLPIHVRSIDRAGGHSPQAEVWVWATDSSPTLSPIDAVGPAGVPLTITASANEALWPIKEFRVTTGTQPDQVVAAVDNRASFQVTPVQGESIWVRVRSVSVDGTVSSESAVIVSASEG